MIRVLLNGCLGAMGAMLSRIISEQPDMEVAAGIDVRASQAFGCAFPVFETFDACNIPADVVIDFSVAAATDSVLDACEKKKLPLVIATTGLSENQLARLKALSETVPLVQSYNMSLGVNLLASLIRQAAPVLAEAGFDIEIVEQHHRRKLDAPSGTALLLADAANEALKGAKHYTYDRSGRRMPRDPEEIGISAVRGGTIVGVHDVIFAGEDEVVELKHQAFSRAVFAKGAVAAARFLMGKESGYYTMQDVING